MLWPDGAHQTGTTGPGKATDLGFQGQRSAEATSDEWQVISKRTQILGRVAHLSYLHDMRGRANHTGFNPSRI